MASEQESETTTVTNQAENTDGVSEGVPKSNAPAYKVPESLVQGVSVSLAGSLNEESNFTGTWKYTLDENNSKPLAFTYKRSHGPPPIPNWQYALVRTALKEHFVYPKY